jgi:chromosome partitioning protein
MTVPDDQIRFAAYIDKGGVTKTTTAGHMGRAMAGKHDLRTLLIDAAGRQNDLATMFGLQDETSPEDLEAPLSAVFRDDWDFIKDNIPDVVDRMVFETDHPNLDLIPSDPGLEGADNQLANVPHEERFEKLNEFVNEELAEYDAVVFDLPGKESNIALNGLLAAENVVAPIKPGKFEQKQISELDDVLQDFVDDYERDIDISLVMVIPSAINLQKNLHEKFITWVEDEFPERVSPAYVVNSANVESAPDEGRTVFDMPDDSLYSTGKRARDAYAENTAELLTRLRQ